MDSTLTVVHMVALIGLLVGAVALAAVMGKGKEIADALFHSNTTSRLNDLEARQARGYVDDRINVLDGRLSDQSHDINRHVTLKN